MIEYQVATLCVAIALSLDTASYWRQIRKTIKTKKSTQVSSTSFIYKIAKALAALIGLAIYKNFVGMGMEMFMLVVYVASLYVIIKYKPKKWRLWK